MWVRREWTGIIWPNRFGADALFRNALDPITNHRTGIVVDRVFHGAFIIIDKQPRWDEHLTQPLFHLIEFNGPSDRVCRTTSNFSLIVNVGTLIGQIDLDRQLR